MAASGTAPLSYQWYKAGTAISGATSATYTIGAAASNNAASYTVVVSNSVGSATSSAATLTVNPAAVAPAITTQPASQAVTAGGGITFTVVATGTPPPTYQWNFNGSAINGATSASYAIGSAAVGNSGSYTVTVANSAGSVTSAAATLTVNMAPSITTQPVSQAVTLGSSVTLTVAASGTPTPSYQWSFNGVTIPGATSSTLLIQVASAANAGSYTCLLSNSSGSTLSSVATLSVTSPGRLINLSVNTTAGKSQVLTVGFVTGGTGTTGSQSLLIRATGPALAALGVSNTLTAPTLTVLSGQTVLASNAGWGTPASNQVAVTAADVATGAFPLTNPSSLDSALVANLPINSGYTVQISGNTSGLGTALAEVYDDTSANAYTLTTPRLINLSSITFVAAGSSLTAGFVIGGTTAKTVLVRATGPALAALGVSGTMPDPQIALHATVNGRDTVLASNAGWGGGPQITAVDALVGAFPLTNPTSADSVLLITLAPGAYTAVASSVSSTAGITLIEVYDAVP